MDGWGRVGLKGTGLDILVLETRHPTIGPGEGTGIHPCLMDTILHNLTHREVDTLPEEGIVDYF